MRAKAAVGAKKSRLVAPCLLPSFDTIATVQVSFECCQMCLNRLFCQVASPRFWPLALDVKNNPEHLRILASRGVIYVKRKTGYLSYNQDPMGLRSILSRSVPKSATLTFLPKVC